MVNNLFDEKTWEEFRESGMLWAVNTMLEHLFGWCIVYDYQSNSELRVVPCKTAAKGFDDKAEKEGHDKLIRYLKAGDTNAEEKTAKDDDDLDVTFDIPRLKRSIEKNGHKSKSIIAMEELAELSQVVSKAARYIDGNETKVGTDPKSISTETIMDNFAEEIADVLICIENLRIMYGIKNKDIQYWIDYKTVRQRIKDAGNKVLNANIKKNQIKTDSFTFSDKIDEERVSQDVKNHIEGKDLEDKFEKMVFKVMFGEDD